MPSFQLWIGIILGLVITPALFGAEEFSTNEAVRRTLTFPFVHADRDRQEVRVEAEMSHELHYTASVLEFLLISDRERAYESLFLTQAQAAHILLGLLFVGWVPGPLEAPVPENPAPGRRSSLSPGNATELPSQGDPGAHPSLLELWVEWQDAEGKHLQRIESFIEKRMTGEPPESLSFAFTGSFLYTNAQGEKTLAASESGAIVAVLYDPSALLNLSYFEKSPYIEDDLFGFAVHPKRLPRCFLGTRKVRFDGKTDTDVIVPKSYPVVLLFRLSTSASGQHPLPSPIDSSLSLPTNEEGKEAEKKSASPLPPLETPPSSP